MSTYERSPYDLASESAAAVRERVDVLPRVAFVLGSGLGAALEISGGTPIPYAEIPHFPVSSVVGHAGELVIADYRGVPAAFLSGRVHLYEGYSPSQVVHAVRTMRLLGAETLVLTNAAGGVNTAFSPGDLMLVTDHLNLTGQNPLAGPNDERLGPRFPDMSAAYDRGLRVLALEAAAQIGVSLVQGIYAGLLGPSFETPAEIRAFRSLGADAVGMSTVHEAIAANHMGMQVLGVSCITNMAAGILPQRLSHTEVIETTERVRSQFAALLGAVADRLVRAPRTTREGTSA
jgi:purine-nucleoside phosphorylase